jgi:3-deoxy-manno-octulosonate cytidylyltransferase (CMP-KDO synthetase)
VHPDPDPRDSSTLAHARQVAVIPARYQSSRLPGKPLLEIAGRPMIEHVYERAAKARLVDAVIVATDDERVLRAVERFGGIAWMTRADHRSGTDRVAEVARALACDVVVNVQGDEPLLAPEAIDEVVSAMLADQSIPMGTLCRRITDASELADRNVVKVVLDLQGFALYFSRAPIPFPREGDDEGQAGPGMKHIGLYAYRRDFLLRLAQLPPSPLERRESLEQLRVLEHGFRIRCVETRHDSTGVDTPEGLETVRRLMAADARV